MTGIHECNNVCQIFTAVNLSLRKSVILDTQRTTAAVLPCCIDGHVTVHFILMSHQIMYAAF